MSRPRAPRTEAEEARAERRRNRRNFDKRQRRAQGTGSDPKSVAAAVQAHGDHFLGTALMSIQTQRRKMDMASAHLPPNAWVALGLIPLGDAALSAAGCAWPEGPDLWGRRTWPEHLRWGLDQVSEACRLLRLGEVFGAALIARQQLERWTFNVATHHKVDVLEQESTADYFRRVWSVYPWVAARMDMGKAWLDLSELLHGRGPLLAGLPGPPGTGLLEPTPGPDQVACRTFVADLLDILASQIRGGISILMLESGRESTARALQARINVPQREVDLPLKAAMAPLDFTVVTSQHADQVVAQASRYRRSVRRSSNLAILEKGSGWDLASDAFLERRGRAIERARWAFNEEQKERGDDFEADSLHARLFRYIAIGEAARLVAGWTSNPPEHDALLTAAAALGSAWVVWLEDTDLSMPCARTVLEETCRARAWRIKPQKAERVEASGPLVSPVRWAEAAGWGRLRALSRALGEFAHINVRARWSGARELITDVQGPGDANLHTGRGQALDSAAYLLAQEVAERLATSSEAVAAAFREDVTLLSEADHAKRTEELLHLSLQLRGRDLGQPDLEPLVDEEDTPERRDQ